ncbi:MAG: hypothetical protein KAI18_02090 [Candidatus Aenigmarchaeota archaeon]|nr:hypothetical protein [Candidatus Aenigmarchaeota archaeon]
MSYFGNLSVNETIDYCEWADRELGRIFASADGVDVSEILHPLRRLMRYADGVSFDISDMMKEKVIETYGTDFDMNMIFGTENNLKQKIEVIDNTSHIRKELSFALDYAGVGDLSKMEPILRSLERYIKSPDISVSNINVPYEIEKIRAVYYEPLVDKELFDALVLINDNDSEAAVSILERLGSCIVYVSDEFASLFRAITVITAIKDSSYSSNNGVLA